MKDSTEYTIAGVPREILVGLLAVVFTTLYIKWHRKAASYDAIAYAVKMRQQRQQEADKSITTTVEEETPSNNLADITNPGADITATPTATTDSNESPKNKQPLSLKKEESIEVSEEIIPKETEKAAMDSEETIKTDDASAAVRSGKDAPPSNREPNNNTADASPSKPARNDDDSDDDDLFTMNTNNNWRCACEGGFLPAGMLQTMGGAQAVFSMGIGSCYQHPK